MTKISIAGVGNCASALIQGLEFYSQDEGEEKPLSALPGFSAKDIEVAAGFDVHKEKVGADLSEAIFVNPNCANKITDVEDKDAPVLKGPVMDGLDSDIAAHVPTDKTQKPVSVKEELQIREVDVLVILLPAGSQKAAEHYAQEALAAGCAVVNGIPAEIANTDKIKNQANKSNLPVIGDDVKSQVGATIVHKALTRLFPMRGASLKKTIQLDWGGDMDFCNLLSNNRYEQGKRQSKTESVISEVPEPEGVQAQVSAVDYIPFLKNQKEAYMRLEGEVFGGQPVRIDLNMEVQDAYNSAGILTDCIHVCGAALDKNKGGVLEAASAFFCKKPPHQIQEEKAKSKLLSFLGESTHPLLQKKKRRKEEREKYTESYFKNEYWKEDDPEVETDRYSYNDPEHEKRFDFLKQVITDNFSFDSFLDVGCGTGDLLRRLRNDGYEGKGVEVSQAALDNPLNALVKEGVVKEGGAENIPFSENSFDAVICLDVMEHLPEFDVDQAVYELIRVSDQYIILTINLDNPYEYHPTILTRNEWEEKFLATGKVEQLGETQKTIQKVSDKKRPEYEWFIFEKTTGF